MTQARIRPTIYLLAALSAAAAFPLWLGGLQRWIGWLVVAVCQVALLRGLLASARRTSELAKANAGLTERLSHADDELRIGQAIFHTVQEGIVVTDLNANIVAANPAFCMITEYGENDLRGRNMNLVSSGRQSAQFYKDMWSRLRETGWWQGEIWDRRKGGDVYPQWLGITTVRDGNGSPVRYVGVVADVSRMLHGQSHLQFLAQHDHLTGLANRALLSLRLAHTLERTRRYGTQSALLFVDLDGFKAINDKLGHAVGDQVLRSVAARMKEHLRETDTVARVGGDEFVMVLEQVGGRPDVESYTRRLIERLRHPITLMDGSQIGAGVSVGICLFPADGDDPEQLLKHADAALYRAKHSGRGTWKFYAEVADTDDLTSPRRIRS